MRRTDGIRHVLHGKREVRKTPGFAVHEPQFPVPALQVIVFADDPDADGRDRCRARQSGDVADQPFADAVPAMPWQYRQAVQIRHTPARRLIGHAGDRSSSVFKDEVALAPSRSALIQSSVQNDGCFAQLPASRPKRTATSLFDSLMIRARVTASLWNASLIIIRFLAKKLAQQRRAHSVVRARC